MQGKTVSPSTTNGNGKMVLLSRLAVELTRLAQGRDEKLDYLLERLRRSLREGTPASEFKESAASFLKYIVSGHIEFSNGFELSIKKSAVDLFSAMEDCFPDATEISVLKEELILATSLHDTVEQVKKIIPVLSKVGQVSSNSGGQVLGSAHSEEGVGLAEMLDLIRPALNKLLDQLYVLEPEDGRMNDLKNELVRIASMAELEVVLGQALDLVVDVARKIDQERVQTELFLTQLRLHLKSLEEGISNTIDIEASLEKVNKVQNDVNDEVQGIEAAVNDNTDLDLLKKIISTRVTRLASGVSDYVETEKKQLIEAQDKINELTRQAQQMDEEVEGLRHQLIEKQQVLVLDPLTGVENRGAFDKRIEQEMARSRRIGFPVTLLVVDIDKFKPVNDTFGHKAGDKVLQTIAKLMADRIRDTDYVARYGGDEFVLLLPGTLAEDAKIVAQGFCDAAKLCGFHSQGKSVDISLSIGIAQLRGEETSETFFERADAALYEVKNKGRDGCAIAPQ